MTSRFYRFTLLIQVLTALPLIAPLMAQTRMWEPYVLRADSLFKINPQDTTAILNSLLNSEIEWYFVETDSGVQRVFNPVGEPLWIEAPDYEVNEELIYRTHHIRLSLLGPSHPHVARSLERIGMIHLRYFRLQEAEDTFRRALEIYESTLGPDNPELGRTLHCIGAINRYTYRFDEAAKYLRRSLRVRQEGLPPDHPQISYSMNGLAHLYWNLGRYKEAEQLYRRAYAIRVKAYGSEEPAARGSLGNIVRLLMTQGRYDEAEQLVLAQGDSVRMPTTGYAQVMKLYALQGKHQEAIAYASRLIDEISVQIDSASPYVGELYAHLASEHQQLGHYAEAERYFGKSIQILRGQSNIGTGVDIEFVKTGLANLYRHLGRLQEALGLYDEIVQQRSSMFGPSHPYLADALEERSRCHLLHGNTRLALTDASRALTIRNNHFEESFAVIAEHEALATISFLRKSVSNYLTCVFALPHIDELTKSDVANALIAVKGRVSDGMIRRGLIQFPPEDTTRRSMTHMYLATKGRLAKLYLREAPDANSRREMDSLAVLLREMESTFAYNNKEFYESLSAKSVTISQVADALPPSGILVEYMKYSRFDPSTQSTKEHYLAVVVNSRHNIHIQDLGPAHDIESLIDEYRGHLQAISKKKRVDGTDDARYEILARQLYNRIWNPLLPFFSGDANIVFVAPDGPLNLISFGSLMDHNRKYLVEQYALHNLTSARDLVARSERAIQGSGLLAFGDPDYDATVEARISSDTAPALRQHTERRLLASRNLRSGCVTLRETRVAPLRGTQREVKAIQRFWRQTSPGEPSEVHTGSTASEENLKREAIGKRVLHLATHGYFLGGACEERGGTNQPTENPLLRSGLFLAGANLHGQGADAAGADDGILTALEVSSMDLRGTDLVILSACETGLGKVEQGEGVYGLRRAFQMAGAKTVVSSLWQVPDRETMQFMKTLYATQATTYPELMQQVELHRIQEARLRGRPTHPFTWGAFVATGEWRIRRP